jgi:hypothetical protein
MVGHRQRDAGRSDWARASERRQSPARALKRTLPLPVAALDLLACLLGAGPRPGPTIILGAAWSTVSLVKSASMRSISSSTCCAPA